MRYVFLFLLFPTLLFAQIPLRHPTNKVKGPVLKAENKSYSKVLLDENGKPDLTEGPEDKTIVEYENQLPKMIFHYDSYMGNMEKPLLKFTQQYNADGQLVEVKQYSADHFGKKGGLLLDRTTTARYRDGKLISEQIVEKDGKLLATFEYFEETHSDGKPILCFDHFSYSNGDMKKENRYGVRRENGIKTLHYTWDGTDTSFISTAEERGDTLLAWITQKRKYGEEVKIYTSYSVVLERDEYGNDTKNIAWVVLPDGEKSPYEYNETRYLYVGQADWAGGEVLPFLENLLGTWKNDKENIEITIGGSPNHAEMGIYSSREIVEITESRLMEEGDAWKLKIARSTIGNWVWDAEKQELRFHQNENTLETVKAEIEGDYLVLRPTKGDWNNGLRLKRM